MSHIASNYHMDLTPSTAGNKDRHIVQVQGFETCFPARVVCVGYPLSAIHDSFLKDLHKLNVCKNLVLRSAEQPAKHWVVSLYIQKAANPKNEGAWMLNGPKWPT